MRNKIYIFSIALFFLDLLFAETPPFDVDRDQFISIKLGKDFTPNNFIVIVSNKTLNDLFICLDQFTGVGYHFDYSNGQISDTGDGLLQMIGINYVLLKSREHNQSALEIKCGLSGNKLELKGLGKSEGHLNFLIHGINRSSGEAFVISKKVSIKTNL